MRKILTSLVTISAVSVVVFGATQAYFSDEETSEGNTFTAGSLDLKIDFDGYYNMLPGNGEPNAGQWSFTDLTDEKFFDFGGNDGDIKPGDYGEGTISLHVYDNDAWACLTIDNLHNDDNGLTEPEDVVDDTGGDGEGELAQNLYFFAWADDGDNVYEPAAEGGGEQYLFTNVFGPASDVLDGVTYPLADSDVGNLLDLSDTPADRIVGSNDYYIGISWCAGTMSVDTTNGTITCDGNGMGNETQTDSLTADLSFYVEQWRNNPDFSCSDLPQSQ